LICFLTVVLYTSLSCSKGRKLSDESTEVKFYLTCYNIDVQQRSLQKRIRNLGGVLVANGIQRNELDFKFLNCPYGWSRWTRLRFPVNIPEWELSRQCIAKLYPLIRRKKRLGRRICDDDALRRHSKGQTCTGRLR